MHPPAGAQAVNLSRLGFLVIDDKPLARELVHTALAGRARSVRQAISVEKAIDVLGQQRDIDCIVADWNMPPLGALELLRMIRCRALSQVDPRTNFIIFTSRAEEPVVRCALDLDVNGFAIAPLSLDKLVRTISAALSRTWLLQDVAHYAAIPGIVPRPAAGPAPGAPIVASRNSALSHVQARKRPRSARVCGLNEVEPGSVLARDLRDMNGTLLLRTGASLDASAVDRLRKAAGVGADRYQIWVRR